ncbi:hypothetical protein LNN38_21355 [Pseudomonas sp. LA21]|uniref:hypothetical protein n=1 Tax=Pseudomonas sp. LA21 TaxID=2893373 RepID=UPI001FB62DD0|nr:hypothetical protein [Pseudomonas sp. LA21]MCJ1887422.1 hypothetical protein [Pseudomonas sp. LA21]
MQCPDCGHAPAASEQADPSRCPSCGIYYHKALAAKVRQLEATNAQKDQALADAEARASSASKAPATVAANVRNAVAEYKGAQPVVVLDVNMSFGSMITFMIKWGLASIPALLILSVIFFFLWAFLWGIFMSHPGS